MAAAVAAAVVMMVVAATVELMEMVTMSMTAVTVMDAAAICCFW